MSLYIGLPVSLGGEDWEIGFFLGFVHEFDPR